MKNGKEYVPQPIDTSGVLLSDDILALTEQLAMNAHEVWAAERISQGWTHGGTRDDANKKHPCLVPYADLSEDEKTFDRNTAMETVKLIVKLGYGIERKGD